MKVEPSPVSGRGLLPGYARFAARITYTRRGIRPETLWFDVPEACQPAVSRSGEAWLLALLPLAFRWGERLEVAAPVDPVLLRNATEILRLWHGWHPQYQPVPIQALPPDGEARAGEGRTGLFFTAGVDSFFTALHYDEAARAGKLPGARPVDDLIYVWGYDIPLENRAAWEQKRETLAEIARQLGKHFIPVVSNLRQTRLRKLDWGAAVHGAALGAVGHLLGRRFARLLISSGGKRKDLYPWGSHPRVDPLMATRRTDLIRYTGDCDRFEKTAFIAGSAVALRHLHVCWRDGTARNCGECEKCVRTLLTLEMLGVRDKAASFPNRNLSLEAVRALRFSTSAAVEIMGELIPPARRLGRPDIVAAIEACVDSNRRLNTSQARSPWLAFRRRIRKGIQRWLRSTGSSAS